MTRKLADVLIHRFERLGVDGESIVELRAVLDDAVEKHEKLQRGFELLLDRLSFAGEPLPPPQGCTIGDPAGPHTWRRRRDGRECVDCGRIEHGGQS